MTNINTTPPPVNGQIKGTWRYIKTWQQRTHEDKWQRKTEDYMQEEINELRARIELADTAYCGLKTELNGQIDELRAEVRRLTIDNEITKDGARGVVQELRAENARLRQEWLDAGAHGSELRTENARLRAAQECGNGAGCCHQATVIDELRAENAKLREALHWIARVNAMDYEYQRAARAALGEK